MDKIYIYYIMDYTKYIQSINNDITSQNNQKQLSSNPNYHIEKHIAHNNYNDKTKQNVLSKLKNLIDATNAMKIFNYLVSNNLVNVFLESYDYLTTLKIYNPLSYTQIINYVINYKKNNNEMTDMLREELKDLLKQKVSKNEAKDLKKMIDDSNLKKSADKLI